MATHFTGDSSAAALVTASVWQCESETSESRDTQEMVAVQANSVLSQMACL